MGEERIITSASSSDNFTVAGDDVVYDEPTGASVDGEGSGTT